MDKVTEKEVEETIKKIEEKAKITRKYELLIEYAKKLGLDKEEIQEDAFKCLEELRKSCHATYFDEKGEQWWTTDKSKDIRCNIIEQALLVKSKKEQAFDIVMKLITFDNDDPELSMEMVLAVACAQTFGEQSEEFKIIKEVLNISEEEYNDYVTKYCKKENTDESK